MVIYLTNCLLYLVWGENTDPAMHRSSGDVVDKRAKIKGPDLQVFVYDHFSPSLLHLEILMYLKILNHRDCYIPPLILLNVGVRKLAVVVWV